MARVTRTGMNSINKDLVFTTECQEDFKNEKLPTLDFQMWLQGNKISHTYFQKPTKTPYFIMARSAMSNQQKIQILSNELTRRMSNVKIEDVGQDEKNRIVEQFTQELKSSGYTFSLAKNIVQSGLKGWITRRKNREKNGQEFYRTAKASAYTREKKKLLSRETWYKNCPDLEDESPRKFRRQNNKTRTPTDDKKTRILSRDEKIQYNKSIKSVMFVPFTKNSELARRLRANEENLFNLTRTRVKIVERAGVKLQDLLTTSNPWKGADCGRQNCLICLTKQLTDKNL